MIHAVIVSLGSGTVTGAIANSRYLSNRSSLFFIVIMTVSLNFNHLSHPLCLSFPRPVVSPSTPSNPSLTLSDNMW